MLEIVNKPRKDSQGNIMGISDGALTHNAVGSNATGKGLARDKIRSL